MKGTMIQLKKFGSLPGLLVLLILISSGCATPTPYRLDPVAGDRIAELNATVCVENESISIKVLASSYGSGGGLVGALIDAGVESKRKKEAIKIVAPLKEKTADVHFRDALHDALMPMIKELPWPRVIELKTKDKSAMITAADVSERPYLDIYSNYQLSPTAEVLEISTGFAVYPQGVTKAMVVGSVRYSSERIGKFEENDEAIALWAENDASAYRRSLAQGIEETVKMLGRALPYALGKSALRPVSELKKMKIRISHGRGDYGIKQPGTTVSGWVIEETEERMIFQSQAGGFLSFPKSDIIIPDKN